MLQDIVKQINTRKFFMPETNSDLNPSDVSYDAKQAADEITSGDRAPSKVDVSSDYEASKEYSVSEVDRTGAGEKAAQAATAPDLKVPEPEETTSAAQPTGNPDDYLDMAKEVGAGAGATGNVSDDLVKKAIDLGKPGE